MACVSNTLVAPPCLELSSARKQKEALLLFLCQVMNNLDGTFECANWNTILGLAETAGLTCFSPGQNRILQAQVVCDGLEVDCTDLQCFSQADLEALQVYLMCRIINELNP